LPTAARTARTGGPSPASRSTVSTISPPWLTSATMVAAAKSCAACSAARAHSIGEQPRTVRSASTNAVPPRRPATTMPQASPPRVAGGSTATTTRSSAPSGFPRHAARISAVHRLPSGSSTRPSISCAASLVPP
jgi:hypothetical protein